MACVIHASFQLYSRALCNSCALYFQACSAHSFHRRNKNIIICAEVWMHFLIKCCYSWIWIEISYHVWCTTRDIIESKFPICENNWYFISVYSESWFVEVSILATLGGCWCNHFPTKGLGPAAFIHLESWDCSSSEKHLYPLVRQLWILFSDVIVVCSMIIYLLFLNTRFACSHLCHTYTQANKQKTSKTDAFYHKDL